MIQGRKVIEITFARIYPELKKSVMYYNYRIQDLVEELGHFRQAVRDGAWGVGQMPRLSQLWESQIDNLFQALGMVKQ